MRISTCILRLLHWEVDISAPRRDKCVICVAPHTSNWDFLLGLMAYQSLGRKANFLMKKFWFFWPMGVWLRHFGGIPVDRKKGTDLTSLLAEEMRQSHYMNLAVTPEGTRSAATRWRTGFLRIAYLAEVPVQLGIIDYKNKRIIINREFTPTGDMERDLQEVKAFYRGYAEAAKYPQKFNAD